MSIYNGEGSHSSIPTMPPLTKKLRLIVREEGIADNLFVRLSSAIALDLFSLARRQSSDDVCALYPTESGDSWTLSNGEFSVCALFLPLCISFGDNITIFASYNGGTCVSSSEQDVIEVPRSMLSVISNHIPEFVTVHPLSRVGYGMRVLVEPATVEDWELLEIYSDFMEKGGLLSQVSVIYPKQQLTIRIDGNDRVKIRVKEITTLSSLNLGNVASSVWPDISSEGSTFGKRTQDGSSLPQCVLLIEDTEMIVEPKTRQRKKNVPWLHPFRLIPSDFDWGSSFKNLSKITGRSSFYVDPGCVLVNTEQWPFESEWAQLRPENSDQMRVVRVMNSSRVPRHNAALFIGTRLDLYLSIHHFIYLRPLTATREESLENIMLEEICFEHERSRLASWNVPDIDLADPVSERSNSTSYGLVDHTIFPVGAVIPISSKVDDRNGTQSLDRWFRITSKKALSSNAGHFVHLHAKDIFHLVERFLRRRKRFLSTLVIPEMSTIQRPNKITLSSDWTKSIIDRMKQFSSIFVTLRGVSGSGKTYSALLLSTLVSFSFHRPVFYLDCKKLHKSNSRMIGILEEIDCLFKRAFESRNSIVVLDDLDSLSPNIFGGGDENDDSERTRGVNPTAIYQSKLIGDRLSHLFKAVELRGTNCGNGHLFLIATCSRADSVNPSILRLSQAPLIQTKVPLLLAEDRSDLLMAMMRRHKRRGCLDFNRSDISRRTEGFLPRDIEKLSLRALRSCQKNLSSNSLQYSLVAELADFTTIAQTSNSKNLDQFHNSWADDIGGIFEVKKTIESIVRYPVLYRSIYARARMQLPRGILL